MRKCKCGQPAQWLKRSRRWRCQTCAVNEGLLTPCTGEAHTNPYIDHCEQCAPRWGWMETTGPATRGRPPGGE